MEPDAAAIRCANVPTSAEFRGAGRTSNSCRASRPQVDLVHRCRPEGRQQSGKPPAGGLNSQVPAGRATGGGQAARRWTSFTRCGPDGRQLSGKPPAGELNSQVPAGRTTAVGQAARRWTWFTGAGRTGDSCRASRPQVDLIHRCGPDGRQMAGKPPAGGGVGFNGR